MHYFWLKKGKTLINADPFYHAELRKAFKLLLFKRDSNPAGSTVMIKNSLGTKTLLDTDLNG